MVQRKLWCHRCEHFPGSADRVLPKPKVFPCLFLQIHEVHDVSHGVGEVQGTSGQFPENMCLLKGPFVDCREKT